MKIQYNNKIYSEIDDISDEYPDLDQNDFYFQNGGVITINGKIEQLQILTILKGGICDETYR